MNRTRDSNRVAADRRVRPGLTACGGSASADARPRARAGRSPPSVARRPCHGAADHRLRQRRLPQRLDRLQHLLGDVHGRRQQAHGLPAGHDEDGLRGCGGQRPGVGVHGGARSATSWAIGADGNLPLRGAAEIVAKPGAAAS